MFDIKKQLQEKYFTFAGSQNGLLGFTSEAETSNRAQKAGIYSRQDALSASATAAQLVIARSLGREIYGAHIRIGDAFTGPFGGCSGERILACAFVGGFCSDDYSITSDILRDELLILCVGTLMLSRHKHCLFEDQLWIHRVRDGGQITELLYAVNPTAAEIDVFLVNLKNQLGQMCSRYSVLISDVASHLLKYNSIYVEQFDDIVISHRLSSNLKPFTRNATFKRAA